MIPWIEGEKLHFNVIKQRKPCGKNKVPETVQKDVKEDYWGDITKASKPFTYASAIQCTNTEKQTCNEVLA